MRNMEFEMVFAGGANLGCFDECDEKSYLAIQAVAEAMAKSDVF